MNLPLVIGALIVSALLLWWLLSVIKASFKTAFLIVVAIFAILGWNAFLIQRDNALYDAYYHRQAIENLKRGSR